MEDVLSRGLWDPGSFLSVLLFSYGWLVLRIKPRALREGMPILVVGSVASPTRVKRR